MFYGSPFLIPDMMTYGYCGLSQFFTTTYQGTCQSSLQVAQVAQVAQVLQVAQVALLVLSC